MLRTIDDLATRRSLAVALLTCLTACSSTSGKGDDSGAGPSSEPACRPYATQYRVISIEGAELVTCDFDRPSLSMTCRRVGTAAYDVVTTWDTIDAVVAENQPIGWTTRRSETLVLSSECSVVHEFVYDSSDRLAATRASTTGDSCGGPNVDYDAWDDEGRPTHGTTNGIGILACMGQDLRVTYDDATRTVTAAYSGGTDCRDETISLTYDVDGIVVASTYSTDGGATAVESTFTTEGRAEICAN